MITEFLNRVELRGLVGHAKFYDVHDGRLARFSVATCDTFRGRNGELHEEITWFNCLAWEGEGIMPFDDIHKGVRVEILGRLRQSRCTDGDGNEHIIWEVVVGEMRRVE